jgi:hypothetical protein
VIFQVFDQKARNLIRGNGTEEAKREAERVVQPPAAERGRQKNEHLVSANFLRGNNRIEVNELMIPGVVAR